MNLTNDDVLKILKIIDESNYDEICIEVGDLKVHVRKQGGAPVGALWEEVNTGKQESKVLSPQEFETASIPAPKTEQQAAPRDAQIPEGTAVICAPTLGTFYRAPSPGAKPFVEVGDKVKPDDTVCLVEIMKLFNPIKASVTGTVAQILVETGAMVEYNQPLILVREEPADAPHNSKKHRA